MKKLLAVVLVAFLTPLAALGQQPAGTISALDGQATLARPTVPTPQTLKFKDTVLVRDRITTQPLSLVKIALPPPDGGKALITVRELSALTITEDLAANKTTIGLDSGKIAYGVLRNKLKPGEEHVIQTPNAIASVRGTSLVVEVERTSAQLGGAVAAITHIDCLIGLVFASIIGGPFLQVPAGQGVTITGNVLGPLRPIRANVMAGLQGGKRGGQKQKPDPNEVNKALADVVKELDALAAMPGANASPGNSGWLPNNTTRGVYVPQ